MYTIFTITNDVDEEIYVGYAKNLYNVIAQARHRYTADVDCVTTNYLKKYGGWQYCTINEISQHETKESALKAKRKIVVDLNGKAVNKNINIELTPEFLKEQQRQCSLRAYKKNPEYKKQYYQKNKEKILRNAKEKRERKKTVNN